MTPRRHGDEDNDGPSKRRILEGADIVADVDAAIGRHLNRPLEDIRDHEERLRDLEKWQWKQTGIHVCASILVTIVVSACTWSITDQMRRVQESVHHMQLPAGAVGVRR